MQRWLHKLEHWVDKLIPISLIVLIGLIIGELFYKEQIHPYLTFVTIADWGIIGLFVIDLTFKWFRVRNIPKFLKKYWLDILAIFPFFLVFRALEGVGELITVVSEYFTPTQKVVHAGTEIGKEVIIIEEGTAKIIKEAEAAGKLSRTERFARFLRPLARAPRFLHLTDKDTKKEFKKEIKFIEKEERKVVKKEESFFVRLYKHIVKVIVFFEKPSHHKKRKI
ncbi:MAG: hypothetical protein PHD81_01435 [Candidatus Nanoarchaeia archaeon]|nr:hypothetical protein [Candidatus Nanoarchaeia archaeon]MDD5587750.1 hypothetical protein [Candidatus Nanoarchaeia archaeon]